MKAKRRTKSGMRIQVRTNQLNRFVYIIAICLILLNFSPLDARDINLDEIYVKSSAELTKLMLEKMEIYRKAGAVFIDKNVIFAGWISGDEIIYIKEVNALQNNYIYRYKVRERRSYETSQVKGVITTARISPSGRFYVIKRLMQDKNIIPAGWMTIIDTRTGKKTEKKTPYAFLDFTITNEGNSLILEEEDKGFTEFFPETGARNELLKKGSYRDIVISKNPSLAYLSPDREKILVLNGSGGNYSAKILWNGRGTILKGITSSSEVFWLDNFKIVYRTGYAGNYSIVLYDVGSKKTNYLLRNSFNTNITYSPYSGFVSFLKEQVIFLYNSRERKMTNTGIEGEDIYFAPNGNFISLLYKNLFLVNPALSVKKRIELGRSWKSIYSIYMDLSGNKSRFENEYSGFYIDRKIRVYKDLME